MRAPLRNDSQPIAALRNASTEAFFLSSLPLIWPHICVHVESEMAARSLEVVDDVVRVLLAHWQRVTYRSGRSQCGAATRNCTCAFQRSLALPRLFQRAEVALARGAAGGEVRIETMIPVVIGVGRRVAGACPPMVLDGVEPAVELDEMVAADVVDAGAAVAGVGVCFDESCLSEDAEVLAHERLALP